MPVIYFFEMNIEQRVHVQLIYTHSDQNVAPSFLVGPIYNKDCQTYTPQYIACSLAAHKELWILARFY